MQKVFYVENYNLDDVNDFLREGGRVLSVDAICDNVSIGAFIVVEREDE
jgi:hypothetical protein